MSDFGAPYLVLGQRLKYVREQAKQSLAEVSGAVEIDESNLAEIEAGKQRPAEDILLLLISHFKVEEREALHLWELADYDGDIPEQLRPDQELIAKSTVMLLALDTRTIYSDGIDIAATKAGMTLTFTQMHGKSQSVPIARIGMSTLQAEEVLAKLQQAILKTRYHDSKLLPPPKQSKK